VNFESKVLRFVTIVGYISIWDWSIGDGERINFILTLSKKGKCCAVFIGRRIGRILKLAGLETTLPTTDVGRDGPRWENDFRTMGKISYKAILIAVWLSSSSPKNSRITKASRKEEL
jgi:hypothetical protein